MLVYSQKGFTLIELITVIVIISVLTAVAIPKLTALSKDSRIEVLEGIAGAIRSTTSMVRAKARVKGLSPANSNPGGSTQTGFIVDFPFGSAEVDWRNLCPESRAELGDNLTMLDFISFSGDDLQTQINNQYTLIGYDIPNLSAPTNQGCYVIYDSFGDPNCTITVVTVDC
ncbi:pilus assembly FimT family protein [Pleionea sediminis]|uniref:pilus assembly FimT family protein n=1 Tax=Pleionea sediminis TaxID=2569479 RepID=UPI001186C8ED|nr:type II secretion system protein [Pleionea sediminis]